MLYSYTFGQSENGWSENGWSENGGAILGRSENGRSENGGAKKAGEIVVERFQLPAIFRIYTQIHFQFCGFHATLFYRVG